MVYDIIMFIAYHTKSVFAIMSGYSYAVGAAKHSLSGNGGYPKEKGERRYVRNGEI